jgi:hypothetical protein
MKSVTIEEKVMLQISVEYLHPIQRYGGKKSRKPIPAIRVGHYSVKS